MTAAELPGRVGSDGVTRYGLGGGDAAAALGLSPYKAPVTLWQELRGELEPSDETGPTKWGRLLEPTVRGEYCKRHRVDVHVPPEPLYHPEYPFLRATPDGIVVRGGQWVRGLEVKAPGLRQADHWGEEGTDDVPVEYEVQTRLYMFVTELPRFDFAILLGGQEEREYRVDRDLTVEAAIVQGLVDFWEGNVLAGVPPDPDATDDYKEYLVRRYARPQKGYLKADAELDAAVGRLQEVRGGIKELDSEKKLLENQLRAAVGNSEGLLCSLGRLKDIRVQGRVTTDYPALVAELGDRYGMSPDELDDLVGEFSKRGKPYRRFDQLRSR